MRALTLPIALVVALIVAAPALADSGDKSLLVAEVVAQQQQIRAEAQAGKGRYRDMPARQRDELLSRQAALMKTLEGKQTSADFTATQQVEIFNELEWIEATINKAEDERLVCKREKPTGSHRVATVCKTVAQIRQDREDAKNAVDRTALCSTGLMCTGK